MRPATEWIADLIRRVPILAIDAAEARRSGDAAALAYSEAMRRWQDEAALAIAEAAQESRSSAYRHRTADPYARAAVASALLTFDASG